MRDDVRSAVKCAAVSLRDRLLMPACRGLWNRGRRGVMLLLLLMLLLLSILTILLRRRIRLLRLVRLLRRRLSVS